MKTSKVWQKWLRRGGCVLLVAGLILAFRHNFYEMWFRWFPVWRSSNPDLSLYDRLVEGESYYTHGPLIPLVSLFISFLLVRYTKIRIRPQRLWGGLALGAFLMLHLASCLARVNFVSGFAFIGVLAGLVLFFWGWDALRRLWFPLAFLVFMVPMPMVTIAELNFRLKVLASRFGVALANAVGIIAVRSANRVFLEGDKNLVIANVCNGLRTIISLLAFGALYAYVCRLRGLWRVLLFALTIPAALLSNSLRVLSLIWVADVWNVRIATGWFHDFSGMMIFILAFILMFSLERLILWVRMAVGRPAKVRPLFEGQRLAPEERGQWSRMVGQVGRLSGYGVALVLLLVAGGAMKLYEDVPSSLNEKLVDKAVPDRLTILGHVMHGYNIPLSENDLRILEYPSYINRRYVGTDVASINLSFIFHKDNRKAVHPPDVCVEGGGNDIVAKINVDVRRIPGQEVVPCRGLLAVDKEGNRTYHLYAYRCGDTNTRSFWYQQWIIFVNGLQDRNASGGLIHVTTPVTTDTNAAQQRCVEMIRAVLPHLDKNFPREAPDNN